MYKNNTYMTVLSTDDYLIGVLALNESLKKVKSKYKLTVLINENISPKLKEILKANNIEVIEVKSLELPEWIISQNITKRANWNYTFDKLLIFELTKYDKIVFLDSDMFVRNNIDELFEKKNMSATVDRCDTVLVKEEYQELTSGILVIEPKKGIMSQFMEIIRDEKIKEKYDNIGDQDILQLYDREWKNKKELHLETKYNMFFLDIEYYINKGIYSLDEISVIHFITGNKPWKYKESELEKEYLEWLKEVSMRDYNKNKLEEIRENIEFGIENKKKVLQEYVKILANCRKEINKFI